MLDVFLYERPTLLSETSLSLHLELIISAGLAGQWAPGIHLSPFSQRWVYNTHADKTYLPCGCWDPTQVHVLVDQALDPLSHFPAPLCS